MIDQHDPREKKSGLIDRIDAAFTELSRAAGPMSLVFSMTAVGWMLLRTFNVGA